MCLPNGGKRHCSFQIHAIYSACLTAIMVYTWKTSYVTKGFKEVISSKILCGNPKMTELHCSHVCLHHTHTYTQQRTFRTAQSSLPLPSKLGYIDPACGGGSGSRLVGYVTSCLLWIAYIGCGIHSFLSPPSTSKDCIPPQHGKEALRHLAIMMMKLAFKKYLYRMPLMTMPLVNFKMIKMVYFMVCTFTQLKSFHMVHSDFSVF